MRRLLIGILQVYRVCVSPLLGPRCRFYPSCSCYAQEAIARHGVGSGLRLTALRLLRCHPWHAGGYDPVPDASRSRKPFPLLNSDRLRPARKNVFHR